MFVSPIINTAIRNIGFLESLGVGYHNRWMDFVVITFFVIIINGIIIGCYTAFHHEIKMRAYPSDRTPNNRV